MSQSTDVKRATASPVPPLNPIGVAQPPEAVRLDEAVGRLARVRVRPLLIGLDMLAVVLGVVGAELVGRGIGPDSPARKTAAFGIILLVVYAAAKLYRPRLSLSLLDELPVLVGRWLAAAGLAVLGQVLWSRAVWNDYIINWRFLWGAITIGCLSIAFRAAAYAGVRAMRCKRLVAHRTLIVGAGRVGSQIAEILQNHPEYGLHPIGFVDSNPPEFERSHALPLLGGAEQLGQLILQSQVRNIVVAFSAMKESDMVGVIRTCDRHRCEVFLIPRLYEVHQVVKDMDNAWGLPLVRLQRATYRSGAWRVKRFVDVLFATTMLAVLAPALLLIALGVRLEGGPGVFFKQERVGVDGRSFDVIKFRSLRPTPDLAAETTWNIADSPRLGPYGRFLRKTSLDELPQLFNILRGDMSLVGPRPERPHFVSQFKAAYPSYEARHRVPSGLTGLAQVHGLRGNTSIADRARFDNYYIENWSLWLDLKIMLRTVSAVLRGAGG